MATTQTYGLLTAEQKTFYDRVLIDRLLPTLVYQTYGQKRPAPKKEGDTVNFRKFNALTAATTPLTEGVTPAGNSLSITSVNGTVSQYGDYIVFSDKVDTTAIDPIITETVQVLGDQAALTIDTVIRDIVTAGTSVQYANGRASRVTVAAGDILTGTEIKKAVRTLRKNNAKPMQDGFFVGIIDPDTEYDLMSDSAWINVSQYQDKTNIYKGEVGQLFGVRFVRNTNSKIFTGAGAAGVDIHATMIIGQNAYGVIDIEGSSKPQTIIKANGSSGVADPLDQRSSAGWKAMLGTARLQELAMCRIEHYCSL
ncbi:MAG: N4-gp56 family major capsid protein [Bacillota bacterium]|nr:N4-gp56 family major capsid protein [Bacillota bacterium]